MKENRLGLKTPFIVVTILISMCGIAYAQFPPIPSDYSGTVTVNGEPAPDGAIIYAKILGYTSDSFTIDGGRYSFLLVGPPDDNYIGETIEFHVDPDGGGPLPAVLAEETGTFEPGTSHKTFDLTVVDETPPVIVNVLSSEVTKSGATITWVTDELSTSQVQYGLTSSYGSQTILDLALETSHSVDLVGLEEGTTYHFRVVSADYAGNKAYSVDQTFKTAATSPPPSPPSPMPPSPTNEAPVADAGPDRTVYVDVAIHLSGAGSQDPDGTIEEYHWFPGDGGYESGVKVIHVYGEAGVYTASLTVTDNNGATGNDDCIVTVLSLPAPLAASIFAAIPANSTGYVVDASFWADTTVKVNTTDPVTITVIRYETNPHPGDPMPEGGVPKYVDVFISDPDAVDWPIYVEMAYTENEIVGLDEASLGMYYWMDGAWHRCSDTGVDTERNVIWAYMTAEEASGSPILIGGSIQAYIPAPAEFQFSQFIIESKEVEPGAEVIISLKVTNIGEATGNRTVSLDVGEGLFTSVKTVTLEGGESETLVFTVIPETEGVYSVEIEGFVSGFEARMPPRPAEFVVSDLFATPEVEEGEYVTLSVEVTNTGETEGSYIVEFRVDGEIVDTKIVTLAGGESTTVSFEKAWGVGSYTVEVNGLTESFEVKALPEPEFEVSGLTIAPGEIELGDEVTISFVIRNADSRSYVFVPLVQIGDTMIMDGVELEGHESRTISHAITPESVGDYDVAIDGLEGSFTVFAATAPISPGYIAGIIIVIVSTGAIIYYIWKRKFLPTIFSDST